MRTLYFLFPSLVFSEDSSSFITETKPENFSVYKGSPFSSNNYITLKHSKITMPGKTTVINKMKHCDFTKPEVKILDLDLECYFEGLDSFWLVETELVIEVSRKHKAIFDEVDCKLSDLLRDSSDVDSDCVDMSDYEQAMRQREKELNLKAKMTNMKSLIELSNSIVVQEVLIKAIRHQGKVETKIDMEFDKTIQIGEITYLLTVKIHAKITRIDKREGETAQTEIHFSKDVKQKIQRELLKQAETRFSIIQQ